MTTALILSGGGARAAYQVGVLKAVARLLPRRTHNPFPVISGTSAGAINALAIASNAGTLRYRVRRLECIWRQLEAQNIYRTDLLGVLKNSLKVGFSLLNQGYGPRKPLALLDNTPLRALLQREISFRHIDEAIAAGHLRAIAINAMNYQSGQSVAFFQGNTHIQEWRRARRMGVRCGLTINHLMASAAIPTLFPAVKIDQPYYGDGAMRQHKPLSPALKLGATRLFVIGVSDNPTHPDQTVQTTHQPSIAQIVGHLLNSAFIDSIESDLETLHTINRLIAPLSQDEIKRHDLAHLRKVDCLTITPSQPIDSIASEYIDKLPNSVRLFLRLTGATARGGGASAASYLLFQPDFCREMIRLGLCDALEQEDQIRAFFHQESEASTARTFCMASTS